MLHIYKVTRFTFHIDQQHLLDNSSLFSFNIGFVKEIRCQRLKLKNPFKEWYNGLEMKIKWKWVRK